MGVESLAEPFLIMSEPFSRCFEAKSLVVVVVFTAALVESLLFLSFDTAALSSSSFCSCSCLSNSY